MSFLFHLFRPHATHSPRPSGTPLPPSSAPPAEPTGPASIPDRPGPFRFSSGAQGSKLAGGVGGEDLLQPVGMAYWNNLNAHAGQPDLYAFLGTQAGVWLYRIDKATLQVERLVKLRPGTGEGWYFSKVDPHWLYLQDGPQLRRHHILTHAEEIVWDVSDLGETLWQCHSSQDGQAHSGTLQRQWQAIGCAARHQGTTHVFPVDARYDECQIDTSGQWLLIKEGNDNRLIHLASGQEWTITDAQRALGHSDMGEGYMIGEEDQSDPGGVIRRWDFTPAGPVDRGAIYSSDWTPMSRYVSHCNAPQPVILLTHAQELIKVSLEGLPPQVICPTLWAGGDYATRPKANLDPHGQWACWTTNYLGGPLTAFLVCIP